MCVSHLGLHSFCSVPFVLCYFQSQCITYVTQLSMCLIMLSPEDRDVLGFYSFVLLLEHWIMAKVREANNCQNPTELK